MNETQYEFIDFSSTPEGLAVIMLNRPLVHNAFNAGLIAELTDVFDLIAAQTSIRMVILRGAGKSFSAGADLEWMKRAAQHTRKDNEDDAMRLADMMRKLYELPQMTLALVHGSAMGGGLGLIAACDAAIAMKDTKFRFSEVRLGLTPATISPFVIDAIGPRWARALFVTGETFDSDYAERMGLVQYVAATEQEMTQLEEHLANLVFAAAPGAIADSKRLVRMVTGRVIDRDLSRDTALAIAARRTSDEGKEGVTAFLEKRTPSWKT